MYKKITSNYKLDRHVLTSKLAKSAKPPPDEPNPCVGGSGRVGVGPCNAYCLLITMGKKSTKIQVLLPSMVLVVPDVVAVVCPFSAAMQDWATLVELEVLQAGWG